MSFLTLYGVLKSENSTTKPKMGIVIDNNDPLQIGRVKATVEGMYTEDSAQWIRRESENPLGAGNNSEFFAVPEIGSKIWLKFPFGDDSFPYYTTRNPFGKFAKSDKFKDNYPHEWGWADKDFLFKIDRDKGTFLLKNGKSYVSGEINGRTDVCGDNIYITGESSVVINGDNNVNVKSSRVNIEGSNVNIGNSTTIDGKLFLTHQHSNGNDGRPTGGVI